jgi:nucleoside-diphosphate-sugar epimerase
MHVFVTGANGFIGRDLVQDLIKNGHTVLGLARNDATVEALTKGGAESHRGDLEDIESLKAGARKTDGIIHLAMVHDFQDFERMNRIDRAAIEAMGEAIAGTGKPLVIASGTMLTAHDGKVADEDTQPDRESGPFSIRALAADIVCRLSKENNIRGSVVRLPPTVHGAGDKAFVPRMIASARKNGVAVYTGDGHQRWPAVHRTDAATVFRLAMEKGRPGATYNAVAEQGVPIKEIMTAIADHTKLPVAGWSLEEGMEKLGFLAMAINGDNPTNSEKTKKELGWQPKEVGLLEDMAAKYFS